MVQEPVLRIVGGRKISGGKVEIAGSSNQVTKCIMAALLTNEAILIKGAPDVEERWSVQKLFQVLGGSTKDFDQNTTEFCAQNLDQFSIPKEICQKNRISILAIGPLLHRFKKAVLTATMGGDKIGKRPVDFHIKGIQEMGAHVEQHGQELHFSVGDKGLVGAHIQLPYPSVMTTENLLLAATLAKGRTVIENAAIEPEVFELVKMLQKMGADIMFTANRSYVIQGVSKLKGCELRVMPDRNQAVSFAVAALATGGDILLEKMPHEPVYSFLNFIQRMGGEFKINSQGVFVKAPKEGFQATHIEVDVHPGFMTDWQQPFMVLFTQAKGVSVLHETVFDDRLGYTKFLNRMGANITLFSTCLGEVPCRFKGLNHVHSAIIQGPSPLTARKFKLPTDIRAGWCLVVAGLVAQGETSLINIQELKRKYDNLAPKLLSMGAQIKEEMVTAGEIKEFEES